MPFSWNIESGIFIDETMINRSLIPSKVIRHFFFRENPVAYNRKRF